MPANPERRQQILDTAIDILCDDGVGGLTHRSVDGRAGVPSGTTSNYFRTRQALLEATAERTVALHWQRVEALKANLGPLSRDAVKALMIRMLEPDEAMRRFTLARFELFMESTRRAELRPLMAQLQAAAVNSATLIFESAGFTTTPERMDELSRVLNGFVFSNLTVAPQHGAHDAAGLVDRLLSAFLD
jgi:DNA-binding transcriptional regulator YbjK